MTWFNIPSIFIKTRNHFISLEYICVFWYTSTLHLLPQIYSNFPLYKMKWIFFSNLLHMLYSNIICKNIVKLFQKFEVGYTQTCTSLESNTMWHLKGGHHRVFSPYMPKRQSPYNIQSILKGRCHYNINCLRLLNSYPLLI